jgi:hypothetical protein
MTDAVCETLSSTFLTLPADITVVRLGATGDAILTVRVNRASSLDIIVRCCPRSTEVPTQHVGASRLTSSHSAFIRARI